MGVIDIDKLVQPIAAEDPAGPSLEYHPAMNELYEAAKGGAPRETGDPSHGTPPDWRDVRLKAEHLLSLTKDIEVAVYLARAALHTEGFEGLADGLELIQALLERFWADVHPRLEDDIATARLNRLDPLRNEAAMVYEIRGIPLCAAKPGSGLTLRHLLIARGELKSDNGTVSLDDIEGQLSATDAQAVQRSADAVTRALRAVARIEAGLAERLGDQNTLDLTPLKRALERIGQQLAGHLARRGGGPTAESVDQPPAIDAAAPGPGGLAGPLRSRDQVIEALDMVIAFYRQHEPSSPVPLLIERCKKLARASGFVEVIRELAPEAMQQINLIVGIKEQEA